MATDAERCSALVRSFYYSLYPSRSHRYRGFDRDIEYAAAEGRIHPISQVMDEITEIYADMGFSIAEGPDIEDDFHNFTALNIAEEHPARQMMDTFYLKEKADGSRMVLRTQRLYPLGPTFYYECGFLEVG